MAKFVATEYVITVGGVDLTDHLTSVEIPVEVDEQDSTNFGSNGWRERLGGLKSANVSLNFLQDFAAGEVEATVWPLIGTTTNVVVRPFSGVVSATNPQYTAPVLVRDWKPIAAQVGNLAVAQVTWPSDGEVVRATST
jgi:hypothetical protein